MRTEILIAGGGTGGVAAAMMACDLGHRVILTEETDWVGGQLTAQIVPPDEHPWIEQFGCTRRYREFRNRVRTAYFAHPNLAESARKNPLLNPGSGWVSLLCFEPKIGLEVIEGMLAPYVGAGLLTILRRHKPFSASTDGDKVEAVRFLNLESGEFVTIEADVVLDATELGDLLPMTNTEYIVGAESKAKLKSQMPLTVIPNGTTSKASLGALLSPTIRIPSGGSKSPRNTTSGKTGSPTSGRAPSLASKCSMPTLASSRNFLSTAESPVTG
ncbi:MAG: hypothetical protein CBB60_008920, partial [Armatimonadetes bacterium Cent15-Ar3]